MRIITAAAVLAAVWACVPQPSKRRPIGGECASDGECETGRCFRETFLDVAGNVSTPGGYCTSTCSVDADCGEDNVCVPIGAAGNWCHEKCDTRDDCRDGYACWTTASSPYCFSDDNLTCDPSGPGGTCTTFDDDPGGCWRFAVGSGNAGRCIATCPAPGSCPNTAAGTPQHCILVNLASNLDGTASGDNFRGSLCWPVSSVAIPAGSECRDPRDNQFYSDICANGSECYLRRSQPTGTGHDSRGDNRCHRVCNLITPNCTAPQMCSDVFGLRNSGTPVGFCL